MGLTRGVDASLVQVKKTYRKLARLLHPDVFDHAALAEMERSGKLMKALKRGNLPTTQEEAVEKFHRLFWIPFRGSYLDPFWVPFGVPF